MFKNDIKELALETGFKLKEQPNNDLDLNPYVYDFAKNIMLEQMKDFKEKIVWAEPNSYEDFIWCIDSEINSLENYIDGK